MFVRMLVCGKKIQRNHVVRLIPFYLMNNCIISPVLRIRSIFFGSGSGSTDPVLKIRIWIRMTQKYLIRPDPDPP